MTAGATTLDIGVYGARGLPSTYSGYETFLAVLLPELAARGHTVSIYCRKGEVPEVESFEGVKCVQLPSIRSRELSTISHGFVAAARARAARHDVVLIVNVANALSAVFLRATGARVVMNTDGQEWIRGKWGPLAQRVFWWSARIAGWSANALVADCSAMRDVYIDEFGAESSVIPYCWTELEPTSDRSAFDRLGIVPGEYLLAAGRLVPENNIAKIACAYLSTDIEAPLVVLGAAPARSPVAHDLQRMAGGDARLVLAGHVDDRQIFAALVAEARAYVHGHSVGGINPSLLEAMGCGARIVGLDTRFNREALGPNGTYFDFGGGGASDLTTVLRSVVGEAPETSDASRKAARVRVEERFSLDEVAGAYEELLSRVAALHTPWSSGRLVTRWEDSDAGVRA